ncbi:MAG: alpha/beta fold hydrolase, partial [Anaerolineae bacterium]|nr:alpha/beta fold hydrolase [Anaerolineae bacterium]
LVVASLIGTAVVVIDFSYRNACSLVRPHRAPMTSTPAERGLPFEPVTFISGDGLRLAGWYIPSHNGATIILCHGLGDNRVGMLPRAALLAEHGYGSFLFDFRAHGESEGEMVTYGYAESDDVLAAVDYLLSRPDVDPERIGILGGSLGAATAIRAAAHSTRLKAVVAESAFTSLEDEVASSFKAFSGLPAFPVAPLTVAFAQWQTGLRISEVRPVDDIPAIAPRPVFIIHGTDDDLIPAEQGLRLYEAAGEPKELWMVGGMGHESALGILPDEYERRVIGFFDKALLIDEG